MMSNKCKKCKMSGTCKDCRKSTGIKAVRSVSSVVQTARNGEIVNDAGKDGATSATDGERKTGQTPNNEALNMCNGYAVGLVESGNGYSLPENDGSGCDCEGKGNNARHDEEINGVSPEGSPVLNREGDGADVAMVNGFQESHDTEHSQNLIVKESFSNTSASSRKSLPREDVNQDGIKGSGVNAPAARPKTISWSRTVKHRRDLKERGKKRGRKRETGNTTYSELCSSSDDSTDEVLKYTASGSLPNCLTNGAMPSLSSTATSTSSMESSDYISRFSECYMDDNLVSRSSAHKDYNACYSAQNGHSQTSNGVTNVPIDTGYRYDLELLENNFVSAPLALPEDSDGSSVSNGSDLRLSSEQIEENFGEQTFENFSERVSEPLLSYTTPPLTCQAENLCRFVSVDHVYVKDNCEVPKASNFINIVPPLPPVSRRSSSGSQEEIGDYIETDFPSRACRHMFQSSSRSSSSSTDSDEGYGVNEEPRLPDDLDIEGASYLPASDTNPNNPSCQHNLLSCDTHNKLSSCDCYNVHVSANANNSPILPKSSLQQQSIHDGRNFTDSNSMPAHHTNRLDSTTGRSEEGSDAGVICSDSSVIYSPENDFVEFTDSDAPASASGNHRFFPFNPDVEGDIMAPVNCDVVKYNSNSTDYSEFSPLNSIQGAEGGVTNDLNMYEFDEMDNNMELLDPHLLSGDNENYLYHDICKHEKVPRANFQNSESNLHEKIYFKRALEKENHSSDSGSSDNEENLAYCLPREQLLNVGEDVEIERPPQNCDSADCMVLEDLENLTHALQNAVIMQLPNKLEESSGDSSEDPIYEDIDFIESLQVKGDNLHVVDEETVSEATAKAIPKYCRRGPRTVSDVEKVMIWNEYEAYVLQVKQIGTSACGPTAVMNVLKAFDFQVDKEELNKKIITNTRMETAPIPYYLFSRSTAGTTADSLTEGIHKLTRGTIRGRFFHFYPARKVELLKWLGHWMKKGAVPIATLNLQKGVKPGWTIPDAWHHQMVYGVSSKGVYLTNPLEIVSEETIMEQLTSDSVLLVRRQDVVNRFRDWAPLNDLLKQRDPRWLTMNVLGQVVNVLREACTALYQQVPRYRAQMTSHITIPAAYKAGITLFVRQNTEVAHQLFSAPELELKDPPDLNISKEQTDG